MPAVFFQSFVPTFVSILEIFLVVLLAGLMVRRGLITQAHISGLSQVTVNVFLPAMTFANVVENLDPSAMSYWWVLPLAAVAMAMLGLGIAWIFFFTRLKEKKNLLPLASLQNAGYLVLPVGLALYSADFDRFALYTFLFILGFNPVLWSIGKILATGTGKGGIKGFFTPPFVANFLAVAVVLAGVTRVIPRPLLHTCKMLGDAAVPVATFVLGAVLGTIPWRFRSLVGDAWRVILIKQIILPVATALLLLQIGLQHSDPLLARFFMIQAASAPAVGIILQVRSYGGDEEKIGGLMLLSYLTAVFLLPAWVALWNTLSLF